jgi:hypothetical protein
MKHCKNLYLLKVRSNFLFISLGSRLLQLGQKYCLECKSLFEELSSLIQKVRKPTKCRE